MKVVDSVIMSLKVYPAISSNTVLNLEDLKQEPPRLRGTSINHSILEKQHGDDVPTKFAFYDTRSEDEMFM